MRRLAIVGIQSLFFFAALEIVLRIYNPLPFRVHGSRIVLPVRQTYTFDTHEASKLDPVTHHTKNSLGFRGPDPPADLAKRLSIITIGGSATEELFVSDGKTWTDVLARRIAAGRPDVWVNNAGLDGQSTYGHLVLLRDFVIGLRPKVAIFLVGVNDVERDDPTTFDAALAPSGGLVRRAALHAVDHSEVLALAQNLARSATARQRGFGHSQIDVRTLADLHLDPPVINDSIARQDRFLPGYESRLRRIAVLCRSNGLEPVFVTQPALYGPMIDPSTGVDLGRAKFSGRGNGHLEWQVLEKYNDVTRRIAARERILLIDLARRLPKDSRFFYDHLHYSIEGSEAVGNIVAAGLEPFLREHFGK